MYMSSPALTESQIIALADCVSNGRMGQGISCRSFRTLSPVNGLLSRFIHLSIDATSALFFYDYILTVSDEARYVWRERRISVGKVAFLLARYGAMTGTVLVILPRSGLPTLDSASTEPKALMFDLVSASGLVLRLMSIVSSEFLVALRTWAIWCRSWRIFILLVILSLAAIIPATIIVGESIASNQVVALVTPEFIDICSLTISKIHQVFIVPYIATILYELATLTLSLIRIINWRRTIPEHIRASLIDTLWKDGKFRFVNIAIVLQSAAPQLRTGCSQLQAVVHSILSARMVMHLRDIDAPGCSVIQTETRTAMDFAPQTRISRITSLTITRSGA
ncbi:hypothetical protein D9757_013374 [Collybiopsis confluens]|uniref:DUF6533 domain-containing protein n=1 Tax=Collybiopsis confluens TaxID=2823264 RepID=A0A8H5GDZ4_9AGAR|nr:hypothetical protein D9757_013374 [Collybiopsis confluens]